MFLASQAVRINNMVFLSGQIAIYLTNTDDFSKVNEIYASYFSSGKPARSTVCVAALSKNAKIEIDAIAEVI